jgi:hypothetical protein
VTIPPSGKLESEQNLIIKTEAWRALLLKEGITIDTEEWAGAVDLLNSEVSASDIFRPIRNRIEMIQNEGENISRAKPKDLPLVMLARFGVGIQGRGVFLYLIDGSSGITLYTVDSWENSMKKAIKKAVSELEEKMSLLAWRCLVRDRTDNAMIIDRGRFDGVRKGQKFIGYKISKKQAGVSSPDMEFMIMRYGTRTWVYIVAEEGQEFSKVVPVDNATLLETGDILEIPEIVLQDRERDTRGRKVWDKIYKNRGN